MTGNESVLRQAVTWLQLYQDLSFRSELMSSLCSRPQVDDGCPLWMWRGSVEVEAPPAELLHRLLREQALWDRSLHHAAVVQALSEDAEVYRCLRQDWGHILGSRPQQEHLLLR